MTVRRRALDAFVKLPQEGCPKHSGKIVRCLQDVDETVRQKALDALAEVSSGCGRTVEVHWMSLSSFSRKIVAKHSGETLHCLQEAC